MVEAAGMLISDWSSYSDIFFLLANQSTDPHVKKLAGTFIVHYEFEMSIQNCSENKADISDI